MLTDFHGYFKRYFKRNVKNMKRHEIAKLRFELNETLKLVNDHLRN